MTYLVAFLLAFLVAAVLTPLLRGLAPIIGGIDSTQSSRKIHTQPIPRIGGLAIVAGFYAPLVGLFAYMNNISETLVSERWLVGGLFGGGIAIATLGFLDDMRGVRASVKFAVQICVALLLWNIGPGAEGSGFQIHLLAGIPLGPLALPVTVLWIVGIINALNLIDGLDGLAGGVAAIAIGLNFVLAFGLDGRPDVLMCLFMAALGGAVLGFLLYNFNPATIFMGDSGSMFLGFILAASSTVASHKSGATLSMLVPIIGLGLPIADTLLAIVRRILRGRAIFSPDREHIHHKLLELGLTHRRAVLALYGVCLALSGLALAVTYAQGNVQFVLLSVLVVLIIAGLRRLGYLRIDAASVQRTAQVRTRNQNLRGVVRGIGELLPRVPLADGDGVDRIWDVVKHLAPAMDAQELRLSVARLEAPVGKDQPGEYTVRTWRSPQSSISGPPCVIRIPLEHAGAGAATAGEIEVQWTDGRAQIDRDDEIALEMVKDHIENALDRMAAERAQPPEVARLTGTEGGPRAGVEERSTVLEFRRRTDR